MRMQKESKKGKEQKERKVKNDDISNWIDFVSKFKISIHKRNQHHMLLLHTNFSSILHFTTKILAISCFHCPKNYDVIELD